MWRKAGDRTACVGHDEVMALHIVTVDPHDESAMREYQRVYEEAIFALDQHAVPHSLAETRGLLLSHSSEFRYDALAAVEGDTSDGARGMVGSLFVVSRLRDNADLATLHLHVDPARWGSGVATALVEHAEGLAAERGWRVLETQIHANPDLGQLHFAQRRGFVPVNEHSERRLAIPVSPDIDAPIEDPYAIEVGLGAVPSQWAQSYCDVLNRLNLDAPQGDRQVEPTSLTPESIAEQDADLEAAGRTRITAYALAGDEVVGISCVVAEPDQPTARQWATLVLPEHRGHGLGLALKLAVATQIPVACPDVTDVVTTNARTNTHMIAVNEALGYQVTGRVVELEKRLV